MNVEKVQLGVVVHLHAEPKQKDGDCLVKKREKLDDGLMKLGI